MDTKWWAEQCIGYQKNTIESTFSALFLLQEHMEKVANVAYHQIRWFPEESIRLADQWTEACKKARDDMKHTIDESHTILLETLSNDDSTKQPLAKKKGAS